MVYDDIWWSLEISWDFNGHQVFLPLEPSQKARFLPLKTGVSCEPLIKVRDSLSNIPQSLVLLSVGTWNMFFSPLQDSNMASWKCPPCMGISQLPTELISRGYRGIPIYENDLAMIMSITHKTCPHPADWYITLESSGWANQKKYQSEF